jgi:hypothetical protein
LKAADKNAVYSTGICPGNHEENVGFYLHFWNSVVSVEILMHIFTFVLQLPKGKNSTPEWVPE